MVHLIFVYSLSIMVTGRHKNINVWETLLSFFLYIVLSLSFCPQVITWC